MTNISVIVSMMDRPEHVVESLRSILANPGASFEVVVIDQSADVNRQSACAAVGADPRLRWVESRTRGLSVSRNLGVATATAPVVAFTDDDCRVPADWVSRIRAAFDADADLDMLFGSVVLSAADRLRGYAAEFEPVETTVFQHVLPDMRAPWGVGANMAMRRRVIDRVGPFDEMLGAGGRFYAGEEIDLTIRALSAGLKVMFTPAVSVAHLGIREGAAASRLMRRYGIGLGAALAKHMRLRTPGANTLFRQWLAFHARRSLRGTLRGERHPGLGLVAAVPFGACLSLGTRIDPALRSYVE